MSALLGKKVGMTGIFDDQGQYVPVTVIQAGPCYVTQLKTKAADGYDAVQLGFEDIAERKLTKPEKGHFAKSGTSGKRYVKEFRTFGEKELSEMTPGKAIAAADLFHEGDTVHVSSTSKGRGFQGVVKRHHFGGVGQSTHGQSDRQRAPGSIGSSSYPSRVFKGQRMGGRMGGARITTRNLRIVKVLPEQNLVLVSGSFAGAKNQLVEIVKA
ncbi:MAG TPA: 50S ribosomal protein L3 [Candidatus Kapabacteria bacterium]